MPKGMVAGRMGLWLLFGLVVAGLGVLNGEPVLILGGGLLVSLSALAIRATLRRESR